MATTASAAVVDAQTPRSIVGSPTYQSWQFATPVPLDSITVTRAAQIAAPFFVSMPISARWNASVSGAAFSSQVTAGARDAKGATGPASTRTLAGVSDLRVRASGHVLSDALLLTVGVNVPTGTAGLAPTKNDVLRVLAAPALGAAVSVPGVGYGGTLGAVAARTAGEWALAAGASVEQRGSFTPFGAAVGGSSRTELAPGTALHLSLGADGAFGDHRLSVGLLGDLYSRDAVRAISSTGTQTDRYQLGPTGLVTATLQISHPTIRDFSVQGNVRYRSAFTDAEGVTVAGSSGSYLDLSTTGTIGAPGRPSLVLGADVRQQSGVSADDGFIGAKLAAVGVSVGASLASDAVEWRPALRLSTGSMTVGRVKTTVTSITLGLTANLR